MLVNVWGPVNTWEEVVAPGTVFTVDWVNLNVDSPFTDLNYSAIVAGDSCVFDATTTPDAHPVSMSGDGVFTLGNLPVTQTQTFQIQIWDATTQDLGTAGTITAIPLPSGNIALIMGVPVATIATINGVPIGSIAKFNGVDL